MVPKTPDSSERPPTTFSAFSSFASPKRDLALSVSDPHRVESTITGRSIHCAFEEKIASADLCSMDRQSDCSPSSLK